MLPTISQPTFSITIPSTGKKVNFRRFLVAEEKALLMAKQSGSKTSIAETVVSVAQSCCQEDIDINSLKAFDLDYIFLKLRSQSVDNVVKIKYRPNEEDEDEVYTFSVDLEQVAIPTPSESSCVVKLDENVSVEVVYPTVGQVTAITERVIEEDNVAALDHLLIGASIKRVFNDEEEFEAATEEEVLDWVSTFPTKPYQKIKDFLDTTPQLEHTIKYKKNDGTDDEVVLSGLYDFFTF